MNRRDATALPVMNASNLDWGLEPYSLKRMHLTTSCWARYEEEEAAWIPCPPPHPFLNLLGTSPTSWAATKTNAKIALQILAACVARANCLSRRRSLDRGQRCSMATLVARGLRVSRLDCLNHSYCNERGTVSQMPIRQTPAVAYLRLSHTRTTLAFAQGQSAFLLEKVEVAPLRMLPPPETSGAEIVQACRLFAACALPHSSALP